MADAHTEIFSSCSLQRYFHILIFMCTLQSEMEKRKNIAQTQILDQKIAQITRDL